MISDRAQTLIQNPSPIVTAAMRCMEDPYSADNPKGYLNFGIAQNFLMEEEIKKHLLDNHTFKNHDIHYNEVFGKQELRSSFCQFASKYLGTPRLDPENISIQCGVSALCESLSFTLFNPGETLLMPAPYYPGFYYDFTIRFGVKIETVQLKAKNQYKHCFDDFKQKIDQVLPKAILLTNPYNPTGEVLSKEFKDKIVDYCKRKKIHIIADEIYSLTIFSNKKHESFLNYDYENIHYLYGMAKDFSLAGLRVGFFYTKNEILSKAMQNISYFHTVSTQTLNSVISLLSDSKFLDQYIQTYQKKLDSAFKFLQDNFSGVNFTTPDGGFFIFADFQNYLKNSCVKSELDLFNYFMDEYKINMNPASSMGFETPGFFRICYAKELSELDIFCKRTTKALKNY